MFNFLSQPAEKVLQKATKLKSEGKLDKAISLLEKTVKEIPDDLQILIELGTLYFQTDQHKAACTTFKRAQRLSPSAESDLLSIIESLHFERGKPVESGELLLEIYAERRELEHGARVLSSLTETQLRSVAQRYDQMYKNSIKYKSDSLERSLTIAYCLVALHSATHDYIKSFTMLQKIVELAASEYDSVLKEAQRIVAKEWGNSLLLISLGDLYAKNGLLEKATENYMRAVESDSTKAREVAERIRLLSAKSESETLLRALTQLTLSGGQLGETLRLIARLKNLGANREEITRLYSEVVRLDPSSSEAHLLLGDHFSQNKRFDSAASEYARATELDPARMGIVVDRLDNMLKENPGNEYLLDITFDTCFSAQNVDKAVEVLTDAYKSNPALSEDIGQKLNRVLEKDLTRVDALTLLGKIYFDRGEPQKATWVLSYLIQINEEGARATHPLLLSLTEKNPQLIQARVALADTLVVLRDFEKALEIYFEVMDSDSQFASTIIPKIDLLLREKRSLSLHAAALYAQKTYLDPFVLHYARAEALALAENYSEAVEELKRCIEHRPDLVDECRASYQRMLDEMDNPDVRLALGDVYIKAGKFREALQEFNQVVSLDPKKIRDILKRLFELKNTHDAPWLRTTIVDLLIRNRLHSQAIEEIRSASEKFQSQRGSFDLALAIINQDRGLFEEVVPEAIKAMEEDHSLAPGVIKLLEKQKQMDKAGLSCFIALAQAYEFSGRYNKAIDELKAMTRIYPERTGSVVERLKKISADDPTNPKLSYVRGQLLLTEGKTEEAIEDFSRACSLDGNYLQKIEEVYADFLSRSPTNSDVLLALARLKIEKGLFPEATKVLKQLRKHRAVLRGPVVRELRRIIEKDPRSGDAMHTLVELYMEEENYDFSLHLLDKLVNLSNEEIPWVMEQLDRIHEKESNNPRCLRTMGYGYLKLGDLEKSCQIYDSLAQLNGEELSRALADLKEMTEGHPDHPDALFLHARMLSKKRLVEEACRAFRRLVNMDPSFEQKVIDELESMSDQTPEAELPYLTLSELLERKGEYRRAIDTLCIGLKEVQSNENVVEFHILLANAYSALKDHKRARKELKMAKNRAEFKERFFKKLRELKQERLDFDIAKLKIELNRNLDDHFSRIRLAELLRRRGDVHEALEILRVPMEEPVAKKRRTLEVSLCLVDSGELLTALETLNSVGISSPPQKEDLEILYALAGLYRKMDNPLPAIACLKVIRKTDPKYREAGELLRQEYKRLLLHRSGRTARTVMGVLS